MSSDGRAEYSPLPRGKSEKAAALDTFDVVPPPLNVRQTRGTSRYYLRRRLIVIAIAVASLTGLVAVVCGITSLARRPGRKNASLVEEPKDDNIREEGDNDTGAVFAADLDRLYAGLVDRKTPAELATIFEYYRTELYDVGNVDDFRGFLSVLRSDGLARYPNGLISDNDIRYAFRLTGELAAWYRYLRDVDAKLMSYEAQLRRPDVSSPAGNVRWDRRKRREFDRIVDEWTRPADVTVTSSRVVYKKKVVTLTQVADWLRSNGPLKRDLMVFASRVLYLDADLALPGVNLALVAPIWTFVRDVTVTLNGADGAAHAENTASDGLDGLPGFPGADGGHFFGMGHMNNTRLHVQNKGGSGGDGQNGAPGRDGSSPLSSKPSYGCYEKTGQSYKNRRGEIVHIYKVFQISRCGGNGTNGGDAGSGGRGGQIILANGSVTFGRGADGMPGTPGKGGPGGRGIPGGNFFYADGVSLGTLSPISLLNRSTYSPSGQNGRDGVVKPIVPSNASGFLYDVMREYRVYSRDEFLKGNDAAWSLLRTFDKSPELSAVTPVEKLIAEVDDVDNVEFYDSVIERINTSIERSPDVLTCLRAYAAAKRIRLRRGLDKCVIVDLDVYLENVACDLNEVNTTVLRDDDRATPVLLRLLKNKVAYLGETCDAWMERSGRATASRRKMADVTSLVAGVVKKISSHVLDSVERGNIADVDVSVTNNVDDFKSRFDRHRSRVMDDVAEVTRGGTIPAMRSRLTRLRKSLTVLNDLVDPDGSDVARFTFEIEHLEAALDLAETVRGRMELERWVRDANAVTASTVGVEAIRRKLFDVLVTSQYREALSIFRQWVFPNGFAYESRLPEHTNNTSTLDEARAGLALMRKWLSEYKSTITAYDKYVREADFSRNNSVGPFFTWRNRDVRPDLHELFSGRTILLTADATNSHVLAKSAIKFRTARLELSGPRDMDEILRRVQVEMKHSGYSYYYHKGRTHLRVGEEMDLSYSYELGGNGVPVTFNMVYKKLMDGPPVYSPYTTWAVRLRPVAEARKLLKFANETDLSLVGTGSYIQIIDEAI